MDCNFVKSLTAEQKATLRKLLEEEDKPALPKYEVYVECWENGNIRRLIEYLGVKLHGKDIGWHENGQKWYEIDYHQGELHGKVIRWYEDGQKQWEYDYEHGEPVKGHKV